MLLPMLAEWLCANNGKEPAATRLVRGVHTFLIPTMNPDGFAAKKRYNAAGVDLNVRGGGGRGAAGVRGGGRSV